LFSDLWREMSTLLRDEAELAKAEISEKMTQVQTAATELAAGVAVLYAGFLLLLAAAAAGLAQLLGDQGPWLGPLIVGLVVAIAGALLLARGRNQIKAGNLAPERTMDALRKDANLAKEHAR
jgi:hypothetical protein